MKLDRRIPLAACAALSALLGACVGPVQSPAPPAPPPRVSPPAPRPAAAIEWHDMPATPGLWHWQREGGSSVARFGDASAPSLFSLTCNPQAGTISLARNAVPAAAAGAVTTMTIKTTSQSRILPATTNRDGSDVAVLPARDPLLDAIAYSRGRFAVAEPGLASLYLPSWPEVSRVIEDCRLR